ncbi:MAG TPA: methyltransferase domain-containing protein [Thermoplasmata archaeon]|nr:methyltransferase domain-containing protein [Thermoplasmata archaeon]
MRARALVVPRSRGEEVRRALREAGLLRTDLEIVRSESDLVFPLLDTGEVPSGFGTESERDFAPLEGPGPADYRELVRLPSEERARLPRSFDVVGDIVVIRIPDEMEGRADQIGEALLSFVPGARLVGADRGVRGPERARSLHRIAGSGPWTTRHRENGIELDVDLARAYFSPRLAREHARVAEEVRAGDRVYDLCCGVGPFSLTIARDGRARGVVAVDANPVAIALLRSAYARQGFSTPVHAQEGRVEEFAPSAAPADRIILNLPHQGIKYLPSVARALAPRGRLYYYEVTSRAEWEERGTSVTRILDAPTDWTVVDQHVVHPYSPTSDLAAFVLERRGGA